MKEDSVINELKDQIALLVQENERLKRLLSDSGISFEEIETQKKQTEDDRYDPDQGSRIKRYNISKDTCKSFYYYFRGRSDVYALRYENRNTNKSGYSKSCKNNIENYQKISILMK